MVPNQFKFSVQTPDVAYVVERGDSLSVIARRFNTSVTRLAALNQLPSRNRIQIGQRLLLPQDSSQPLQIASAVSDEGAYTVRRGDTVSLIAARYGVTEQALLGINGLQDPHRIYPGQKLTMPGYVDDSAQVAVIETTAAPTPPAQVQVEAVSEPDIEAISEPVMQVEEQLALRIPPAAVLPDNQELEGPVTDEESVAEALDPVIDLSESNERLVESSVCRPV